MNTSIFQNYFLKLPSQFLLHPVHVDFLIFYYSILNIFTSMVRFERVLITNEKRLLMLVLVHVYVFF